jgi:quinol monooxygenase YgiN
MPKVALIAKITAADGKRDELASAFEKIFPAIEQEDGTEVYVLNEDAGDPNVIWFYELYTDDAALGVHAVSDAMKALGPELGSLMAAPPELSMLRPRKAKGLAI